ncbi:MAG TPA: ComEC/Rec2 family competence protein, partial [Chloroflexota bacterium]
MTLFWLSLCFILGIVSGSAVPPAAALFAAGVCIVAAWLRRRKAGFLPLLALIAVLLGAARATHAEGPPSVHDLRYYNGRSISVQGQIAAEPDMRDTGSNYVVTAGSVTSGGRSITVSGRLELHTTRSQALEYGDSVKLTGTLLEPANSSTVPYADILRRRGIESEMRFPRAVDLGLADTGPLGWIVPLRQRLEQNIDASLPEPEAALLIAITLGSRSAALGDLAPVLVSTGLIHLIAISGIKVAMVAGTIWAFVGVLRRRALTLAVSLTVLLAYVLLTGATASGERSALMWAMVFSAAFLGRGTVAVVSLAFVAALMVAIDPSLPWDIGFQLSVFGTFAIVAFTGTILGRLQYIPSPFREALAVTIAAQLGTLPVVAVGFHSLSILGPIANALVLPLLPLLILLGFALGSLAGVTLIAAPLGSLTYALLHAVVGLSRWLDAGHAALTVPHFAPAVGAVYYAGCVGLALFLLRRSHWAPAGHWSSRARELGIALAAAASVASMSSAMASPNDRLTYTGSGTGLLLQSGGRTALIDGSAKPLAFLEALGSQLEYNTRTIDVVVVTDPRASTIAGLQAVLAHYQIGEVLDVGAEY